MNRSSSIRIGCIQIEETSFQSIRFDIVIALKWQLKFTKNKNIKWIAVINKKNKAVQKLNQLLGFKKEFNSNRDFLNAKSFFKANLKNFNYFIN